MGFEALSFEHLSRMMAPPPELGNAGLAPQPDSDESIQTSR